MKGTKEDDGDYQLNLFLDQPMLAIEIIPKDQNSNLVQIPKNGGRIEAYGAWVTDNPHGWNELHPAWKVRII
ncbi:MAG TPA: hypothetical protein VFI70_13975 [Nitrososphaeraceae archaeon]|nr:hypothetical protein [Nitrososphaeraceae archaeon]